MLGLAVGLEGILLIGLVFGIVFSIAFGLVGGLVGGPVAGVVYGLASGLVIWLMVVLVMVLLALWRVPLAATSDATPRLVYQKDVQSKLLVGLAFGLVWGFGGLVFGLGVGFMAGLGGLMFGLGVGLVVVFWDGAASSLLFTELALFLRGRRVRFMPLLETALARQVLRQAGAVYQFRHANLQDRLADNYKANPKRLLQRSSNALE